MKRSEYAANLVRAGKTFAEAARDTGMSWNGVKYACKTRGVQQSQAAEVRAFRSSMNGSKPELRKTNRARNKSIERMIKVGGMTYSEIADAAGCSRSAVAGVVYRMRRRAA